MCVDCLLTCVDCLLTVLTVVDCVLQATGTVVRRVTSTEEWRARAPPGCGPRTAARTARGRAPAGGKGVVVAILHTPNHGALYIGPCT